MAEQSLAAGKDQEKLSNLALKESQASGRWDWGGQVGLKTRPF